MAPSAAGPGAAGAKASGCAPAMCVATSVANACVSPIVTVDKMASGTGMPRIKYENATAFGTSTLNFGCFATAAFTAACTEAVNLLSETDMAWAISPPYRLQQVRACRGTQRMPFVSNSRERPLVEAGNILLVSLCSYRNRLTEPALSLPDLLSRLN